MAEVDNKKLELYLMTNEFQSGIKIGYSKCAKNRSKEFENSSGSRGKFNIVFSINGPAEIIKDLEKTFHKKYERKRLYDNTNKQEWFNLELIDIIEIEEFCKKALPEGKIFKGSNSNEKLHNHKKYKNPVTEINILSEDIPIFKV